LQGQDNTVFGSKEKNIRSTSFLKFLFNNNCSG
jgi:hypothetical protein